MCYIIAQVVGVRYNGIMFILTSFLRWWYIAGWKQQVTHLRARLTGALDFFSIELLARTFFSPFRQISAGKVQGPLGLQLRALVDRILSRLIGAMIRGFMMIVGVVSIVLLGLGGGVLLLAWAIVPVVPVLGVIAFVVGWVPWKM